MERTPQIFPENGEPEERYLVASIGERKIAFTARWVREILIFKRSQILKLPFYDSRVLGVVHHHNQIIPLVSGRELFSTETKKISQTIVNVVRLNKWGTQLTGVGVVVDRMVENIAASELKSQQLFQLTDIPVEIWQPQR